MKIALDNKFLEKAPGPDGMTISLYKKHWLLLGSDIYRVVLGILNDGESIADIDTFITLIPKNKIAS